MARNENPPFPRGQTFYGGGTIDANNLGGANLEGLEMEFEDLDYGSLNLPTRSGRKVRCRVVRNVAAAALLPKRLVTYKTSKWGKQVDGYATTTAQSPAFPVDEFLPAAGVPVNDLFWIVVSGPALVKTGLANGVGNNLAVGDKLVALTAATSGATTAGRVQSLNGAAITSAPTDAASATAYAAVINGELGRAITAATTNQTDTDILCDVGQW